MVMLGGLTLLIGLFILILTMILPLIAIIDIVKSRFEGNNKLIWVLVVILMNALGAVLYFAIGRSQKMRD
jgi:hypothetical protein